jgi:hypothetical protein
MHKNDITHYDPSGYPVGTTCGACGHSFGIDPCTEEGLKTIKDPVHGGRVNVACCPHCEPEYYEELQARMEEVAQIEDARLAEESMDPGLLHNLETAAKVVHDSLDKMLDAIKSGDMEEAARRSHGVTNYLGCAAWYSTHTDQATPWFARNTEKTIPPN